MFKHVLKYQNNPTGIHTQAKHLLEEHISFTFFSTSTALVSVSQTMELANKGQNEGFVYTRSWYVSRWDKTELGNQDHKDGKTWKHFLVQP